MKEKLKTYNFIGFNIKIFTTKPKTDRTYYELIFNTYSRSIIGEIEGDKAMILRLAWTQAMNLNSKKYQILYGKITRFTIIKGDQWFNSKLKDYQKVEIPLDVFPNPHETDFFFIPSVHRFFVRKHPSFSSHSIKAFLESALQQVKKSDQNITIDPISSRDLITQIISNDNLISLDVKVTYTNSDIGDVATTTIDKMLKEAAAGEIMAKIKPGSNGRINSKSTFIRGLLGLAVENGSAVAVEKPENGKKHRIVTSDHPEIISIQASSEEQLVENFFKWVMKKWRGNAKAR